MIKKLLLIALLLSGCSFAATAESKQSKKEVQIADHQDSSHASVQWCYHYQQLDEEQKQNYQRLYEGIASHEEEIILENADENDAKQLYHSVLDDHPQLFYVQSQFKYGIYADHTLHFYPAYDYDEQESSRIMAEIDESCEQILAAAPSGSSDEEMAAYLYQYVIEHVEYESNERDQQMDSFFLQGKSVCAGYSKAYQYLMEKAGIPCTTLSGHLLAATGSGQNKDSSHAWNMIKMEDDWFYVDATSGDVVQYGPHTCYQFFLMSSQEIEQLYQSSVPLMETKDPSQSYFRKNDLYLRHYDEDTVQNAIDRMKKNGEKVLELRTEPFATQQLKEELLSDNRIFELLRKNEIAVEQLGCAQLDELGSIEFYYN